jgi:hypothetical protein
LNETLIDIEEDRIYIEFELSASKRGVCFDCCSTGEWRDVELSADDCEALGQKLLEFSNRIRAKGE